ncbi:MAG: hypothetical protein HY816_20000 [Candidatus Wallbacteria bacterium]|nr:hypothetical protein [Candidatus Wallbacteria bacterium]
MIPVMEVVLSTILRATLDQIQANPDILDVILALPDAELSDAKGWFGETAIGITQGWPRGAKDLPCYAILLASDAETIVPIGERMGKDVVDQVAKTVTSEVGGVWRGTYRVEAWAGNNGNETLYLYHVAKHALILNRSLIGRSGLSNIQLSGGDFEPKPDYFPEFVYRRGITVSGEYDATALKVQKMLSKAQSTAIIGDPVIEPGLPSEALGS